MAKLIIALTFVALIVYGAAAVLETATSIATAHAATIEEISQ